MKSQLESVLFIASKPLGRKELSKALAVEATVLEEAIAALKDQYNDPASGIHIVDTGADVQMVTNPANAEIVEDFTKQELMGELTRAQLETLTVVAYQGPITRPEIEAIRGVNCSIILRNLAVRGLVEEEDSVDKLMTAYRISGAALRQLGISTVAELPDFASLYQHSHITTALNPTTTVEIHA